MSIKVRNISKTFGVFRALDNVSLEVPHGELVALLGPSGSGKTTILRIIAGLETPDAGAGEVLFDDADVSDSHVHERRIGFVFQHYALFRHMTVFENVAFGLRVRPRKSRPSKQAIAERVRELLALVQLDGLAERYPSQLSGGQSQRIALARALASEPKVLLLDEPFGALDARVRAELREWLRRLHDEIHITSVFVTHDQEEALEVADRIVVMNAGHIEQVGTPDEVFHRPATEFVINFLGNVNLFHGRIERGRAYVGAVEVASVSQSNGTASLARVFVRPHDLDLHAQPNGASGLRAIVRRIHAAGPTVKLELAGEHATPIRVELSQEKFRSLSLNPGAEVYVTPQQVTVFADDYAI